MELVVVAEPHPDAGLLEVVAHGNLFFDKRHNLLFLEAEERLFVHLQGLLQGIQLTGEGLREAVFLQRLFHLVKQGPGRRAVVELLVLGKGDKLLIVREMEVLQGGDALVCPHIVQGVLLDDTAVYQRVGEAGVFVRLHNEIRGDAAAVAHGTAVGGGEGVRERVRNVAHGAVFVTVRVVDGLHASARRGIILGRSELELAVVGQGTDALHQALPVGARADDGGAVVVLQGAGDNFRGRCRGIIDQYHDGNFRVYGVCGGLVHLLRGGFALGADHHRAFGDEQRDNVHGLSHDAAAVAAKIQYQTLHSFGFQLFISVADLLPHAFREFAQVDVSVGLVEHAGVLHGRQDDAPAHYRNLQHVAGFPAFSCA